MSIQDIWRSIYKYQDGRCFECGTQMTLELSTKRAYTFHLICQACYKITSCPRIVIDDPEFERSDMVKK